MLSERRHWFRIALQLKGSVIPSILGRTLICGLFGVLISCLFAYQQPVALPFQMVGQLGWWAGPVVALISFTLFGIEEIGIEIENPFGRDSNDLPLDAICKTMLRNVEDLISLTPSTETADLEPYYKRFNHQ